MSWVRIDDLFPDHPKVVDLSDGAFRLQVEALCYCSRNLTDGLIKRAAVRRLGVDQATKRAAELVDAGLWVETDDGWEIHDYLEFQPSRAQVEEHRSKGRDRQAKSRASRKGDGARHGVTDAVTNGVASRDPSSSRPQLLEKSSVTSPGQPTDSATTTTDESRQRSALEALVDLKMRTAQVDSNPAAYRATVEQNTIGESGDQVHELVLSHPEWPARWVAQHVLGLPRSDPSPGEVISTCAAGHGPSGMIDTGEGAAPCPQCAWARNGDSAGVA